MHTVQAFFDVISFIFLGNQWLQFDFGPPRKVTGILTLGRGDGRRKRFVTQYSLSYSNNSVVWHFYKDDNHLDPKVSSAVTHRADHNKSVISVQQNVGRCFT